MNNVKCIESGTMDNEFEANFNFNFRTLLLIVLIGSGIGGITAWTLALGPIFQIARVPFAMCQVTATTLGVHYIGQKQCYLKSTIFGLSANEIEFGSKGIQKSIQLVIE